MNNREGLSPPIYHVGGIIMKGITFGNLHTYDDLQLILTTKEIGAPAVKSKKIDIEGADGVPLQRHGCRTCQLCSVQARQYMVRRGG